jgi:hypothetical protein
LTVSGKTAEVEKERKGKLRLTLTCAQQTGKQKPGCKLNASFDWGDIPGLNR